MKFTEMTLANKYHDAVAVLWPLIKQHSALKYDFADKSYLRECRQYRSTDWEWFLSGILLGLLLLKVAGWPWGLL